MKRMLICLALAVTLTDHASRVVVLVPQPEESRS